MDASLLEKPDTVPDTLAPQTTPLRFITCGSVDDGKSTLIGRLLWDTKAVPADQAEVHLGIRKSNGLNLPNFANLLDGLQAEREQGITIDVAYRYFSTSRRSFIVADTPGHTQYTRNMATGASTADLAVLLVDARSGILEQTRRHATIVHLMGIRQLILVVNKIDLIDYDEERFAEIVRQFKAFAEPFGFRSITAIPTSAIKGENVVAPAHQVMPWYEGHTLLEALELAPAQTAQSTGFRLPVQRVSRPNERFRGYQGTIAGGAVKPGDGIVVLPSGKQANVSRIVTFDLIRNAAVAGDAVTLVLDRQIDISRGDMIASVDARPATGHAFNAKMIVLADAGLQDGKRYWLKSASRRQWVVVKAGKAFNLQSHDWMSSDELAVNEIVEVGLVFDEMATFDAYDHNRETGSFILIDPDSNDTVAGGMIDGPANNVVPISCSQSDEMMMIILPKRLAETLIQSDTWDRNGDAIRTVDLKAEEAERLLRQGER